MIFTPLEQFEANSLISLVFTDTVYGHTSVVVYMLLSNMNIFTFVVFSILFFCSRYVSLYSDIVPHTSVQCFLEKVIGFVSTVVWDNTAAKHKMFMVFVPFVISVFGFIVTSNFVGMVPYSFTVTSSLAITFSIALSSFIGLNVVGACVHRVGFFALFLPSGCPLFIAPFIILIETVSYAIRPISLAVRLFANMMAGHTLLKILAGFAWQMLGLGGVWSVISLLPVVVISAVSVLELAVAFLQAYVFTVLICLYIKDAVELH